MPRACGLLRVRVEMQHPGPHDTFTEPAVFCAITPFPAHQSDRFRARARRMALSQTDGAVDLADGGGQTGGGADSAGFETYRR